jgi:DNA-directed RNA polymerase specialized sigma24 family protein
MAAEGSRNFFRLNAVDRRGRKIDPAVLEAAEGIYSRALDHGVKLLGDPAVVTTALEEVAATVSMVIKTKDSPGDPLPIRNLRHYLFRAFLRQIDHLKRKELVAVGLTEVAKVANPPWANPFEQFEHKLLLDECLAICDSVTQDMASRRMHGFTWEEIGRAYDLSAHAAESRFSHALRQARKRLKI